MAARKAVTAAAWVKAEEQYADHSIKVSDIAKTLGLTSIELSNAAKASGWTMRTASLKTQPGSRTQKKPSQPARKTKAPSSGFRPPSPKREKETTPRLPAGSTKESRKAQTKTLPAGSTKESRRAQTKTAQTKNSPISLVQRVYATIDGELSKLEEQSGTSSQDRERASRALSQITNSLEKAVEMQRDIKRAMTKASGRYDKEALAHAEDLRRAIAERLERLQRQRILGKRSGSAE